jgi:hypothetical protein
MLSFTEFRALSEAQKVKKEDVQSKNDNTLEDPDKCVVGPGKECLIKTKK